MKKDYSVSERYVLMCWLADELQTLAKDMGYVNIFQPGLMREIKIAELLNHRAIGGKRGSDACNRDNPSETYEYLNATIRRNKNLEDTSFQMDRMYGKNKSEEQHKKSVDRIIKNQYFFHVLFDDADPLKILRMWRLDPIVVLKEAERQLESYECDHISFSLSWTKENGELIYDVDIANRTNNQ